MGAVYPNPHLQEFQDSDLYQQDSNSLVTYTQIPLYGQEPDLSRVTYTTGDTDLQVTYASSVEGDLGVKYGNNTAGSSYGGSAGSIDDGSYDEDRPHSVSFLAETLRDENCIFYYSTMYGFIFSSSKDGDVVLVISSG